MDLNLENKDKLFFNVCNSVLKLEIRKGHLLWSISEVSRDSNTTRSLIYYYFGKEKENILQESVLFMLGFMFSENTDKLKKIEDRVLILNQRISKMPYLLIYFIQEKSKDTKYSEMIKMSERNLLERLQLRFPELDEKDIFKIYILELGLISYQHSTPEQIGSCLKMTNERKR